MGVGGGFPVQLKHLLPVHSSLVSLQLGLGVNGGTGHRCAGSSRGCGDVDSLGLRGCLSSCCHLQREKRGGGRLVWPGQLVPQLELGGPPQPVVSACEQENVCKGIVSLQPASVCLRATVRRKQPLGENILENN